MENDILDFEEKRDNSPYASRSVKILLYTIVFFVTTLILSVYLLLEVENDWFVFALFANYLITFLLGVTGLINGILSILKNEQYLFFKCIGAIGNTVIIVITGFTLLQAML